MNKLILRPIISVEDKNIFISEIQEAFQNAYIKEFGEFEKTILPTNDIEESFNERGAEAYVAEIDGERVGGAIIIIDNKTNVQRGEATPLRLFPAPSPLARAF